MLVFADFWLLFDVTLELCIVVLMQEPLEDGLLNFLVIFLLKELVVEKLHRAQNEDSSAVLTHIEGADRPIRRETDWSARQNRHCRPVYVQRRAVRIHELQPAVLVTLNKVVLINRVALRILSCLLISGFGFSLGNSYQFLIKNSIADEGLFGMQVLIEVFPDD